MHITDIRKRFILRNPETGQTCSPYGSIPPGYTERVDNGYTFGMDDGTVGFSHGTLHTMEVAVAKANEINAAEINRLIGHANRYKQTAPLRMADKIPLFSPDGTPCDNMRNAAD